MTTELTPSNEGLAGTPALLARLGIDAVTESVWSVLLADSSVSLDAVEARLGLTTTDIARAVDELLAAQLVRRGATPSGVVVIDPELALGAHISRAQRDIADQAAAFAALTAQIPALAETYERGRATAGAQPGFEILVDLNDIRRHLSLAAEQTEADIRSLEYTSSLSGDASEVSPVQADLLARGVRDRCIIAASALESPEVFAEFERWQGLGHSTRTLPDVSTRLLVFDRRLAVLPVDATELSRGAIFIRVQSVVNLLCLMYDHMWSVATPVFGGPANADAPVGRTARILELLAIGTKDERIARALGISMRTVRREIADLKILLGVTSRTEIIAGAIRLGWL